MRFRQLQTADARAVLSVLVLILGCSALVGAASADILTQARSLAENKHRPEALELLSGRLKDHPEDVDARLLFGLVLSWEGRYAEARSELKKVLEGHPDYTDATLAAANVELWDDHPDTALSLVRAARTRQPANADLVLAEAKALKALKRQTEADRKLQEFLEVQPNNAKSKQLRNERSEGGQDWGFSYDQTLIFFSDHRSPWREEELAASRQTDFGSVFLRVHHADQYSIGSNLLEFEAYPRIRPGTYAFVSGAYSPDAELYAHYRAAGEVFQNLPKGFEASFGYRHFRFSNDVNMLTGSAGKYYGNWLFTGRLYFTPGSEGDSRSVQLSARRYFGNGATYMTFRGGYGASPFEIRNINEVGILNSASFGFEFNRSIGRRWAVKLNTGFSQEDRIERNGLQQYVLDGALYYRF